MAPTCAYTHMQRYTHTLICTLIKCAEHTVTAAGNVTHADQWTDRQPRLYVYVCLAVCAWSVAVCGIGNRELR